MDLSRSVEVSYAGPSSSSISNTSSSRSNRTRRTQGSSSSDEEPPFLGDSEVINEDFRCGGPHLVPLPAMNDHFRPSDPLVVAYDEHLREQIADILEQYHVDYTFTWVIRRSALVNDFEPVNWHDTLLVSAEKHKIEDGWYLAPKKALALFRERNLPNLNIEILDERAERPTITLPVSSFDPFVAIWSVLRQDVLEVLGDKKWLMLSVLRRGPSKSENWVTITVNSLMERHFCDCRAVQTF